MQHMRRDRREWLKMREAARREEQLAWEAMAFLEDPEPEVRPWPGGEVEVGSVRVPDTVDEILNPYILPYIPTLKSRSMEVEDDKSPGQAASGVSQRRPATRRRLLGELFFRVLTRKNA